MNQDMSAGPIGTMTLTALRMLLHSPTYGQKETLGGHLTVLKNGKSMQIYLGRQRPRKESRTTFPQNQSTNYSWVMRKQEPFSLKQMCLTSMRRIGGLHDGLVCLVSSAVSTSRTLRMRLKMANWILRHGLPH